jgi:hypothetical protein
MIVPQNRAYANATRRRLLEMHECPRCSLICDCDGDDTWVSWPFNDLPFLACAHDCEEGVTEDDWEENSQEVA